MRAFLMKRVTVILIELLLAASCSSQSSQQSYSSSHFVYGSPRSSAEAEQIGFEMLGSADPLLLPDAVYERVKRDITLIRSAQPELADQVHDGLWTPDHLLVGVADGYTITNLAEINAYYQINPSLLVSNWYLLKLPGKLNVHRLAAEYSSLDAVSSATVDEIVGQENYWIPEDRGDGTWRWSVDDGFYDCFDGCDCHTSYLFDVDKAGNVVVVDRKQYGAPYCVFP
jgi:hypothetical protein